MAQLCTRQVHYTQVQLSDAQSCATNMAKCMRDGGWIALNLQSRNCDHSLKVVAQLCSNKTDPLQLHFVATALRVITMVNCFGDRRV